MREQFEKLPSIAERLNQGGIHWDGEKYTTKPFMGNFISSAVFLNGAWYAFQEQEERFNKRRPELDSDTCSDIRNHVSPLTKVIDR